MNKRKPIVGKNWPPAIIRDDSLLPKDGNDSTVPGPAGADSVVPGPAGADGVGITWRGLFNRRTDYKPQDAVSFDGSSWIAVEPSTGREPSDTSRYWQLLAAKGERGKQGEQGGAGQRGRAVRQYEIESRLDEIESQLEPQTAIAAETIMKSQVIVINCDSPGLSDSGGDWIMVLEGGPKDERDRTASAASKAAV